MTTRGGYRHIFLFHVLKASGSSKTKNLKFFSEKFPPSPFKLPELQELQDLNLDVASLLVPLSKVKTPYRFRTIRSGTLKNEKITFRGGDVFFTHSLQIARKPCIQCSHYKDTKIRGHSWRRPLESRLCQSFIV